MQSQAASETHVVLFRPSWKKKRKPFLIFCFQNLVAKNVHVGKTCVAFVWRSDGQLRSTAQWIVRRLDHRRIGGDYCPVRLEKRWTRSTAQQMVRPLDHDHWSETLNSPSSFCCSLMVYNRLLSTRLRSVLLQVRLPEQLSVDLMIAVGSMGQPSHRYASAVGRFAICLSRPGRSPCMLLTRFLRMCSSYTFHSRCRCSISPFYWFPETTKSNSNVNVMDKPCTVYGNRNGHNFARTPFGSAREAPRTAP